MGEKSLRNVFKYLVNILLVLFACIQIFPLVWLFFFSLKDNAQIFGGNVIGFPTQIIWSNYDSAISSGKVGLFFMNSLIVTFTTIVFTGLLATMASYGMVRMKWKFSQNTLMFFLLGLMIPLHAALLPLFIILRNLRLIDTYWALIIPYVGFALPMAIFILAGFLQSIPRELEESACIDGCNIYRVFFSIILPLIKPAIATISIFTYLSSWNEMMFAVTFINKQIYKTLTVGIMSMAGRYSTEWGPMGAGLVIATLPTIIVYTLIGSQIQKSLTVGAIKG